MAKKVSTKKKADEPVVEEDKVETVEQPVVEGANEETIDATEATDTVQSTEEDTTEKIVNDFKEVSSEINENLSHIDETTSVEKLTEELSKLDRIEESADKKIKELEKNSKLKNKDAAKHLFGNRRFAEYWSGISSGWD